ncbi:MAG: ABC transporter permease [Terracidiphilus sp.]
MNRLAARTLAAAEGAFLRACSPLVPAARRADWLREWQAESWHVRRCPGCGAEWRAALFCAGALPDALELRRLAQTARPHLAPLHRSASYCLLVLAVILAAGWAVGLRSPGVVAERHPERYTARPGLVLIKDARAADWAPSISAERYRQWSSTRQQYFSAFAFYRIERESLAATGQSGSVLPVAEASAGLFALLGLPTEQGSTAPSAEPSLVLSDAVWRREFAADPRIVGRMVEAGGRVVRVAAVLPDGAWRLPGAAEAWLLTPDSALQAGPSGFAVARLMPSGWEAMWNDRINIQNYDAEGNEQDFWAVSFRERTRGPWGIYFISILVGLLALPALTSVSLAEATSPTAHLTRARQAVRWLFLAAKLALILAILYIVPLDMVYTGKPGYDPGASGAHLLFTLLLSLFGLWWAVADQRKRCPVCLRRVTHPARVGIASRTFLAWNGTELMCTGGHTLLEVPALPTSWFGEPRWVYLDASWEFLFAA